MPRPRPVSNPHNRFETTNVEYDEGEAPSERLEIMEEQARSILTENASPDVGFRFSLNPYRGCSHGCIYCYARPTHQYLGLGSGTDFDRRIVVKTNAPELLAEKLASKRWKREAIAFSGNTDCYQPLELRYGLTRRCLEVCLAYANPVTIITKGTAIRRDVELLAALAARAGCRVSVSCAFADEAMRRAFDPFAPPALARIETMRLLADAGLDVCIALAPIIPAVNDSMIPELLERAAEAGAKRAFMTLVRLSDETREYFTARLREALPDRAEKIEHALLELRGGKRKETRFGHRMRGVGARWDTTQQLFELHCRRHGLVGASEIDDADLGPMPAPPVAPPGQLRLPLLD
ncbi:MAG: radical SAM protein [Sandaracinaceae bacterium]